MSRFKFVFIKEVDASNDYDTTEITFKSKAESLPVILEDFGCFLKASGFVFDGSLEIVSEDE